jgi:uncharacterized protein
MTCRPRAGWSILVTGRARVVYDESEASRLNRLNLHPWATTVEHPFWVRIHPTSVTGRRTPGAAGPAPASGEPPVPTTPD